MDGILLDPLQVKDASGKTVNPATTEDTDKVVISLQDLISLIKDIQSCKGVVSDLRVTLLSGTVTTVSSLTDIGSIGGTLARPTVQSIQNTEAILSNIQNIGVTK